jgi:hypothetical protein
MPSPSALNELAQHILRLKYGELTELGRMFCDMVEDSDYDMANGVGYSELLHNWAEGRIEADKENE